MAMGMVPGAAKGEPILKIYNDSLTTYKASAKSNVQNARPLVDQRGVSMDGSGLARGPTPLQGEPPFTLCGDDNDNSGIGGGADPAPISVPGAGGGVGGRRLGGLDLFSGSFTCPQDPGCPGPPHRSVVAGLFYLMVLTLERLGLPSPFPPVATGQSAPPQEVDGYGLRVGAWDFATQAIEHARHTSAVRSRSLYTIIARAGHRSPRPALELNL
jgi:hypothetical protein